RKSEFKAPVVDVLVDFGDAVDDAGIQTLELILAPRTLPAELPDIDGEPLMAQRNARRGPFDVAKRARRERLVVPDPGHLPNCARRIGRGPAAADRRHWTELKSLSKDRVHLIGKLVFKRHK